MNKRIPPKGTEEYRHYWRDRRIIDELERMARELQYAKEFTEPQRVKDYTAAFMRVQDATFHFKKGWMK